MPKPGLSSYAEKSYSAYYALRNTYGAAYKADETMSATLRYGGQINVRYG